MSSRYVSVLGTLVLALTQWNFIVALDDHHHNGDSVVQESLLLRRTTTQTNIVAAVPKQISLPQFIANRMNANTRFLSIGNSTSTSQTKCEQCNSTELMAPSTMVGNGDVTSNGPLECIGSTLATLASVLYTFIVEAPIGSIVTLVTACTASIVTCLLSIFTFFSVIPIVFQFVYMLGYAVFNCGALPSPGRSIVPIEDVKKQLDDLSIEENLMEMLNQLGSNRRLMDVPTTPMSIDNDSTYKHNLLMSFMQYNGGVDGCGGNNDDCETYMVNEIKRHVNAMKANLKDAIDSQMDTGKSLLARNLLFYTNL
jgi:hypothetical protein